MKKLLSLAVSLGILALIYWKIDFAKLGPIFTSSHGGWMAASLAMVVPLTLVTAWRFVQLVPAPGIPYGEALRLILSASVLNLVLPSKMGDIAKAFFMPGLRRSLALSLVVFEKASDMLALLIWCIFGLAWVWWDGTALRAFDPAQWAAQLGLQPTLPTWLGAPLIFGLCALAVTGGLLLGLTMLGSRKAATAFFARLSRRREGKLQKLATSWAEMQDALLIDRHRLARICTTSLALWLLHLLQVWLFLLALRAHVPFLANLALSPLAILAGLMPLTFAGVGTRDAALVLLYAAYFPAPTAAALGLLCTARYLLPALGGIPFFQHHLATLRREHAQT